MEPKDRIIVSLDVDDLDKALSLIGQLWSFVGLFRVGQKLGFLLLTKLLSASDSEVNDLSITMRDFFFNRKDRIFLDSGSDGIHPVTPLSGVKMFSIYSLSGIEDMRKAVAGKDDSLILASTILPSVGGRCRSVFDGRDRTELFHFTRMLLKERVDGIACCPHELLYFQGYREFLGLKKAVAGVAPCWSMKFDGYEREMTPCEAIRTGAEYLIIGSPIIDSEDPVEAATRIADEIEGAL